MKKNHNIHQKSCIAIFCTIWHHIVPTVLLASIHILMKCIPFMYMDHTEVKNQVKNHFW